jgi:hypothetical protein
VIDNGGLRYVTNAETEVPREPEPQIPVLVTGKHRVKACSETSKRTAHYGGYWDVVHHSEHVGIEETLVEFRVRGKDDDDLEPSLRRRQTNGHGVGLTELRVGVREGLRPGIAVGRPRGRQRSFVPPSRSIGRGELRLEVPVSSHSDGDQSGKRGHNCAAAS